nr:hypothetical protein Iba_chr07aCG2800 [Ipomoea batatas]
MFYTSIINGHLRQHEIIGEMKSVSVIGYLSLRQLSFHRLQRSPALRFKKALVVKTGYGSSKKNESVWFKEENCTARTRGAGAGALTPDPPPLGLRNPNRQISLETIADEFGRACGSPMQNLTGSFFNPDGMLQVPHPRSLGVYFLALVMASVSTVNDVIQMSLLQSELIPSDLIPEKGFVNSEAAESVEIDRQSLAMRIEFELAGVAYSSALKVEDPVMELPAKGRQRQSLSPLCEFTQDGVVDADQEFGSGVGGRILVSGFCYIPLFKNYNSHIRTTRQGSLDSPSHEAILGRTDQMIVASAIPPAAHTATITQTFDTLDAFPDQCCVHMQAPVTSKIFAEKLGICVQDIPSLHRPPQWIISQPLFNLITISIQILPLQI